jgi:hypothetical protein
MPPNIPPEPITIRLKAPGAVIVPKTGTLSVEAKLTKVNNVNVPDGETNTVQVPFIVL